MKINNSTYIPNASSAPAKNVSFGNGTVPKGSLYSQGVDKIAEPISKWMVNLFNKKPIKSMIKGFSHSPLGYTHMMTIESIVIGGFYMFNTARNKKIEKEQKLPLIINDGLVTSLAAVLNYTMDDKISSKIKQLQDSVKTNSMKNATKEMLEEASKIIDEKKLKQICAKLTPIDLSAGKEAVGKAISEIVDADTLKKVMNTISPEKIIKASNSTIQAEQMTKIIDGIGKFKTLAIFTIIYRYLSPVLITPIANNISGKIQHSIKEKKAAANEAEKVAAK